MGSELESPDHLREVYGKRATDGYREDNGHSLNLSSTCFAAICQQISAAQQEQRLVDVGPLRKHRSQISLRTNLMILAKCRTPQECALADRFMGLSRILVRNGAGWSYGVTRTCSRHPALMGSLRWLDTDAVVHGSADSLLAAEIAFSCLDRYMPE